MSAEPSNSISCASPDGTLLRSVTASSNTNVKPDTSNSESQKFLRDGDGDGAGDEVAQANEELVVSIADEPLAFNDEKNQNLQQDRRASAVSCRENLDGWTPPAADTAPIADNASDSAGAADADRAGRRGSEFLLIAAHAAEAAELAEKAQSRADAIRRAAIQLTSESSSPTHWKMLEPDQQLRAQVCSMAALRPTNPTKSSSPNKPRPTPVKHVYHDYASAPTPNDLPRKKTGGVSQPFPEKLMWMLDQETENNPDVVTWCSHGRAFVVRKPKAFTAEVMNNYFKQSKLTSFQRQLNLYGFRRITQGVDAGAYYHELFLRGRPDLSTKMVRQKVKGTGHKQPTDVSTEPNFFSMPPVTPMGEAVDTTQGLDEYPPKSFFSTHRPPMAAPDGRLYTDWSKSGPGPSPSLQAVAALRRLSNPALDVTTNFSLGAPAIQTQQLSQQTSNVWSDISDPYPYEIQPMETTLSPSKVHGFQPTSSLGSCPVASEAAMVMTQMFSSPGTLKGGENGVITFGVTSYPV